MTRPTALRAPLFVLLLSAAAAAAAAQPVWRCGSSYTSDPCPGGQPLALDDPRSDAHREQARDAVARERALLRELVAERREREAAWRAAGSGLAGIKPPAAAGPAAKPVAAKQPPHRSSRPAARGTSPAASRASRRATG